MIEKLPFTEIHSGGEDMVDRVESRPVSSYKMQHKINEPVDTVNEIMTWRFETDEETAENVQPDFITTSYMADGHTQEYYGQNGARVQFNYPIPAGYTITIKETKGAQMIEKLDKDCGKLQKKINELVDAVNEQQKQIDKMSFAILDLATPNGENKALESIKAESKQSDCPEQMGYIKLDSNSLATFLKIHPQYNKNGMLELNRTRKALDKGMEHITGLNNMIESWLNLINSDLDQETKLRILKSAISAYVENKGGNNEK